MIYSEAFYSGLQRFIGKMKSREFILYTLVPDAAHYFFAHFSKYSIARIASDVPYEDYIEFFHRNPGNSLPDALLHNAETIALYSNEPVWGIIGSKDLEIGIVGFKNEEIKNEFVSCFDEMTFTNIKAIFDDLNEMLTLQPDTKAIHSQMIKNYSR